MTIPNYLSIFHRIFGEDLKNASYNEFSYDDYWTGEFNNTFLIKDDPIFKSL